MKNEITTERGTSSMNVHIWVRGDEDYVRTETARLLADESLVEGYGLCCIVKPQPDSTREKGAWVACLKRSVSCD